MMVMTNMAEISRIAQAADYVSRQSDRWLFIGLLLVFGVVLWYVSRYFVRRDEELMADFKAATVRYENSLREITNSQQKTITDLAVVLARNTEALQGCMTEMQKQGARQADCLRIQDEFRRMVATKNPG